MKQSLKLPPDLDKALRRELLPGETVLWSGQPQPKRMRGAFAMWLFALPWTAFSFFFATMTLLPWVASSKTPTWVQMSFGIVMPLFSLPFIGIGFWMLWAPIKAVRAAKHTVFALTNDRLLSLVDGATRSVHSIGRHQIGPMTRTEWSDGAGSLRIQTGTHKDSDGDRVTETFDVMAVPEVAKLERLILEARQRG